MSFFKSKWFNSAALAKSNQEDAKAKQQREFAAIRHEKVLESIESNANELGIKRLVAFLAIKKKYIDGFDTSILEKDSILMPDVFDTHIEAARRDTILDLPNCTPEIQEQVKAQLSLRGLSTEL